MPPLSKTGKEKHSINITIFAELPFFSERTITKSYFTEIEYSLILTFYLILVAKYLNQNQEKAHLSDYKRRTH
jgi:hypothetical protein